MIYVNNLEDNLKLFEALASPVRLKIIEMLKNGGEMNINDIAKRLNLTNSALTMHIQKLSDCGVIRIHLTTYTRGTQKLCSLMEDKMLIELVDKMSDEAFYETELEVGQYADYAINPTCGLATPTGHIAEFDNPQAFSYPERFQAHMLWFTDGYITYRFPNKLLAHQKPKDLQISFEISGEAPGAVELFPSDIHFLLNGIDVGMYECPGEFFERKGRYTPNWWNENFGQYGRLKVLSVNRDGTYLDGLFIGRTTISDLQLEKRENLSFTVDCRITGKHNGGVNLFGSGFGDYNQGIRCRLFYNEEK